MKLLMWGWGILCYTSREAFPCPWSVCEGGTRSATRLPRMSQTCSVGFISEEYAGLGHHSTTTKSYTFVREYRIVSSATFPPEKITPIFRMKRITGLAGKKRFFSFHFFTSAHAPPPALCELDGDLLLT